MRAVRSKGKKSTVAQTAEKYKGPVYTVWPEKRIKNHPKLFAEVMKKHFEQEARTLCIDNPSMKQKEQIIQSVFKEKKIKDEKTKNEIKKAFLTEW